MTSWDAAPTVVVYRPLCPVCGASERVLVRSVDQGDGSRLQLAVCRRCSGRFRILVEVPEVGNLETLPAYSHE